MIMTDAKTRMLFIAERSRDRHQEGGQGRRIAWLRLHQTIETKKPITVAVIRRPPRWRLLGAVGMETYQSEYSIPRVNPVAVEGAEDVYGAEGTSDPIVGGIPVADWVVAHQP